MPIEYSWLQSYQPGTVVSVWRGFYHHVGLLAEALPGFERQVISLNPGLPGTQLREEAVSEFARGKEARASPAVGTCKGEVGSASPVFVAGVQLRPLRALCARGASGKPSVADLGGGWLARRGTPGFGRQVVVETVLASRVPRAGGRFLDWHSRRKTCVPVEVFEARQGSVQLQVFEADVNHCLLGMQRCC
jgi:hypothetical protein